MISKPKKNKLSRQVVMYIVIKFTLSGKITFPKDRKKPWLIEKTVPLYALAVIRFLDDL